MSVFRSLILLCLFTMLSLTLTSCKTDDPQPAQPTNSQLLIKNWRLDEIKQNGQVVSSDATIKDRYSLTFQSDGTYKQKLLADNTTYNGTWMLMNNNSNLHLTDHKGTENSYNLVNLTASELRYNFTNKAGELEERIFSAQP